MRRELRRRQGSALIVTVMLLLLLGVIGLSALDTVMRDQQVAGFQNRSTAAFYAAEAGLARAKEEVATNPATFYAAGGVINNFPTYGTPGLIGDTATYPAGQPVYYGDPDVAQPIEALPQFGKSPGMGGSNMRIGGQQFNAFAQYRLRVAGRTADGALSKLEVVALNPIVSGH